MKLPDDYVKEGLEIAEGSVFMGFPLEELSKKELLAVAAQGWKAYNDNLKQQIKDWDFLAKIRKPPESEETEGLGE